MLSALKALDPLDEKDERGENHDRQPDIDEVEHGALLGVPASCWGRLPAPTPPVNPRKPAEGRVHARPMRRHDDP